MKIKTDIDLALSLLRAMCDRAPGGEGGYICGKLRPAIDALDIVAWEDFGEDLPEHPHTKALREILKGSKPAGRWLDDETDECPNGADHHNPDIEPPGCTWHPYEQEEQDSWLEAVADIAERALKETE